jgi:nitrogen regulatory protein PII
MKKVEAFIKPEELPSVSDALREAGFFGACVMEAGVFLKMGDRGGGRQGQVDETLEPKLKLELFLEDHEADRAGMVVAKTVASDEEDRTRIFITNTEESVRYYPDRRNTPDDVKIVF